MQRNSQWNAAKRDATVAQFKRIIDTHRTEEIKHAVKCGHSLKRLMTNARVVIVDVDDLQIDRYLRRYQIPASLRAVFFAVAMGHRWSKPPITEKCTFCFKRKNKSKWGCKCATEVEISMGIRSPFQPSRTQTMRFLGNYGDTLTPKQKKYLANDRILQLRVARYRYDDPTVEPDSYLFELVQARIHQLLGV